jgi:hypothetical protein
MSPITLIKYDQVELSKSPNYLVQGLIPRTGISVLWGPPKSGKTFWLFDLMTHVASNREYRGHKINGGPVVYCCFEGVEGYGARIAAIRQHGPQDGLGTSLYLMSARLDFAGDYPQIIDAVKQTLMPPLSELARQIAADVNGGKSGPDNRRPAAIVLDTLNRSFSGSESNDADMAAYIHAADALRAAFSCAVIIVHHCGHSATRPRGHSSLTGAVDAQLSVKRSADDKVIVEVEWMRDGPEGERIISRLKPVEVGADSEGDPITSCIVVPADADEAPTIAPLSSAKVKLTLEALDAAAGPDGWAEPAAWRDEMHKRGVLGKANNQRVAFKRIKDKLVEADQISESDGMVRRAAVPSQPLRVVSGLAA